MKKNVLKKWLVAGLALFAVSSIGAVASVNVSATGTEEQTETFVSSDLIMPGASVRIENDGKNGIRFPVRLTPEKYDAFKSKISESGTLIVPKTLYGDGELVLENVGKSGYDTEKVVTTTNWKSVTEVENEGTDQEKTVSYMQTMIYAYNIPEDYLNDEFCVKGYVIIDGETVYSELVERSMTEVAIKALPDYASDIDKTGILQSYIKYDVTFDAANGTDETVQLVGFNGKAAEPEEPTPASSYAFSYWALNGEKYDFDTVVTEDITLTAVYEQVSRYEVMLGDGSGAGWGQYSNTTYNWGTTFEYTQFEGNNVMAMTVTAGETSTAHAATFTQNNLELLKVASSKKYIGYRVYSENGAWIQTELTPTTGSNKKFVTRILKGWNEIVIDLAKANSVINADNPLKTFAFGVVGNTEWLSTGTATVYFDDIYATDYDVSNIVDFESVGDAQRFTSVGGTLYAQTRYNFADGGSTLSVEEIDGEYAMKVLPKYKFGQINFLTYSGALFNKTITDYSSIEVRVKVNSTDARLSVALGNVLTETQIVDGSTQSGWVTYSINLTQTAFSSGSLTFKVTDASENNVDADVWFYIDYIKFVK